MRDASLVAMAPGIATSTTRGRLKRGVSGTALLAEPYTLPHIAKPAAEEAIVRYGAVVTAFRGGQRFVVGEPIQERFLRYVMHEPNTGCWLWIGQQSRDGYGKFTVCRGRTGQRAHRISCEIFSSPIPRGMAGRHTCDTPLCVNPDHVIPGTQKENIRDCIDRGRRATRRPRRAA